jgi:hydrogenase maturation protein HypF
MLKNKINVFTTSSAGRLFDAVASILDICHSSDYEGHAPILLEQAIGKTITDERYPICFVKEKDRYIFDWEPMILTILEDIKAGISRSIISAKFHNTLAYIIVFAVKWSGEKKVVLSGGCFQNKYLLERTIQELEKETDISVFTQSKVPMNDGGISLGQITAVLEEINKRSCSAKATQDKGD